MISRRTTIRLADAYSYDFYYSYIHLGRRKYMMNTEALYDFLFGNNYPAWFCNLAKNSGSSGDDPSSATRKLKEFVMRLHTGESISAATSNWTWPQREKLGQEFLLSLATDMLSKWSEDAKTASEAEQTRIRKKIPNYKIVWG